MQFKVHMLFATPTPAELAPFISGGRVDLTALRLSLAQAFPGATVFVSPGSGYPSDVTSVPVAQVGKIGMSVFLNDTRPAAMPASTVDIDLPEVESGYTRFWMNA